MTKAELKRRLEAADGSNNAFEKLGRKIEAIAQYLVELPGPSKRGA